MSSVDFDFRPIHDISGLVWNTGFLTIWIATICRSMNFTRRVSNLIEAYERAGFYAYHLAEHHSTPIGMAPSPSVFLSAIAQRTKHLRFGPMVYALPLHHPLRLIEEICMVDQLSGGRLEIGFGRGSSPTEEMLLRPRPGASAGHLHRGARADSRRD